MATTIQLARRPLSTPTDALRTDAGLNAARAALQPFLDGRDLQTLTGAALVAFVSGLYGDAQLEPGVRGYLWVWDEKQGLWVLVCVDETVVTWRDDPDRAPIELRLRVTASYA